MRWCKSLCAALLAAALVACGSQSEYELQQNFEYHFYPDEYEEAFSQVEKTIMLEDGTEYRIQIQAACESGTLTVSAACASSRVISTFRQPRAPMAAAMPAICSGVLPAP